MHTIKCADREESIANSGHVAAPSGADNLIVELAKAPTDGLYRVRITTWCTGATQFSNAVLRVNQRPWLPASAGQTTAGSTSGRLPTVNDHVEVHLRMRLRAGDVIDAVTAAADAPATITATVDAEKIAD